jgi:hypothetical protein
VTSTGSVRAQPPEPDQFPFTGLLIELRGRGFGIGLREYHSVARLAERWTSLDRNSFRDAIAALLARNAEEVGAIRTAFDDWMDADSAPAPPPPKKPKQVSGIRPWHIALIVVLLTFVAVALIRGRIDVQRDSMKSSVDATPRETPPRPVGRPTHPPPELPAAPRKAAVEIPWLAAAILATFALAVLAALRAKTRRDAWLRRYWQHVLDRTPGPHHYDHRVVRAAAPMPRGAIEDVATILGRSREIDTSSGDTLDVEESLRRTLREGLRPQLVFQPPPRNVPVVVLQDVGWQMRPWREKIDYFLDGLVRQGVVLERWYFEGDPLRVSRAPRDLTIPLEVLTARQSDASLMVFSSGQSIEADALETLGELLKKWTFRTWVDPIGNPSYWRRALARLPIRMWPMTAAGVRAAAVEIARKRDVGASPATTARRRVTRADVERMQQLIALVPHPSLELAEELRSRFCDDIPEEVLLFLGAQGVFYGETIRFPPAQLQRLLDEASHDPERERAVRMYLLEMLRESEPPRDSVAHLRWRLDDAMQRLRLGDDTQARLLRELAQGPLADEVHAALALLGDEKANDVTRGVDAMPRTLDEPPPQALGPSPPIFAAPRIGAAFAVVAAAVFAALAVSYFVPAGEGDPIPHRVGAYSLQRLPSGLYVATARVAGLPPRATMFRERKEWSEIALSKPLAIEDRSTGAWFQVRALLPEGNLAVSDPVWVPAVIREAAPQADVLPRDTPTSAPIGSSVTLDITSPGTAIAALEVPSREAPVTLSSSEPLAETAPSTGPAKIATEPPATAVPAIRWDPTDDTSRRVVEVLTRLSVPREKIEPSLQLTDLEQYLDYGTLWGMLGAEFGITLDDVDLGESRDLEELIGAIDTKSVAAIELTFRGVKGEPLRKVKYQLVGFQTVAGTAGDRVDVRSGIYRITTRVGSETVVLQTIEAHGGKPLRLEVTVPAKSSFRAPRARSLRLVKGEAEGAIEETWTLASNGRWSVKSSNAPKQLLQVVGRLTVNGVRGTMALDGQDRELFIPDVGMTILSRAPLGEWSVYATVTPE